MVFIVFASLFALVALVIVLVLVIGAVALVALPFLLAFGGGRVPLAYNLRNLVVRKATTGFAVFGIAAVVFVLASTLMLSNGIKHTLGKSGRSDDAIVIRKGSDTELSSSIEDPSVGLILAAPGVKKDDRGAPLGVGEIVVVVAMDKLGTTGVSNVQVRGVPETALAFRPEVQIVAGRAARAGTDEVMVGQRIRGRFKGLEVGQSFDLRKNRPATVVGVFAAAGSSFESEVWVDRDTLKAAFGREGVVSSVRVRLEAAAAFEGFQAAVESDKNLGFEAMRENDYYEKQSQGTSLFVTILGAVISFFFSLGAIVGAAITLHASIASRRREVGTLRALGFSRPAILGSFLFESLLLAVVGGSVGALVSLAMGFVKFSVINFQSWSEMVFSFTPTPAIIGAAVLAAALMGVVGGFFPALGAALTSPIEAMRD